MSNRITLNKKLGIIEVEARGPQTLKIVSQTLIKTLPLRKKLRKHHQEIRILLDLSDLSGQEIESAAYRLAFRALDFIPYHKIAIVGKSPHAREIAKRLRAGTSHRSQLKLFETRPPASHWLIRSPIVNS